jgi:hypothetical protein
MQTRLGLHLRVPRRLAAVENERTGGETPGELRNLLRHILDSTRNILILTADDRVFELPAGYNERLHALLAREIRGAKHLPGKPTQH